MNAPIIVGPLLGYEEGGYYTVCILTQPLNSAPLLQVSGRKSPVPFVRKDHVGDGEFWRAEFKVTVNAKAVLIEYAIKWKGEIVQDRHGRERWEFFVPGKTDRPKIAYASCNGFSSAKLVRDTNQPFALWKRMADEQAKWMANPLPDAPPYSLLLMGGDQVYADELWDSKRCPELRKWSELSWDQQHKAKVSPAMAAEIAQFYNQLYIDRWSDPDMTLMFASIPSVMMWDDHDIFDGWGSYPPERQQCAVFQAVFKEAARLFEVFQLRCGTRNRLNPKSVHRALRLSFRDYQLLVLDNRTERTQSVIMSESQWNDVKAWLAGLAKEKIANLLVMAGVPVVYRSFAMVEAIMDKTPWHEETEDDVHDHWSSRPHLAERIRLVMVLLNFLRMQKDGAGKCQCKGVLLSGDVHVGALGQIWNEREELGLTQIISTGIVHPPPTAFQWAGISLMTSDTPEPLGDGDVVAEMLTPIGSSRYLRTRNFATLQTGTDQKLWVNWVCEDPKLKPSFAIS